MKKLVFLPFLVIQVSSYTQNDSNWNVGFEFSIEDLSIDTGGNNAYLVTHGNVNGYGVEFDKINYSLGLTTNYMLSKNIGLSSGILYSNKDFTGTFNCASCLSIRPLPFQETIEQRFLTVPVAVNYTFLTGKLKPFLQGGFKNNIEIKNDLEAQSNGYFLEAFFGASLYYEFVKNWNLGIGYNYQTALSDLYKTDDFNLRTNSFFLRINYKLK